MALADLLAVPSSRRKIGISEERINAIKPILRQYIAYWRDYPDMFVDFLQTGGDPDHPRQLVFYFYQRVFLRASMRYKYVYMVFPRGYSKSFLSILVLMCRCILYPRCKLFITSGGKQQAAGIAKEKVEEICNLVPAFRRELDMRPADDALPVVDQFGIVQITPEESSTDTMKSTLPVAAAPDELGLTDDDVVYLRMKWGNGYKPEDWVWLERLYNDMCDSYDVQTAGHKDTLILVCKTSLKCNQLVDLGDIEGYQKMSRVYNDLMKSGKFTAAQNKEEQGEFVDSISEIVALCEKDGFIPRFYQDSPNDKVDRTIQDMQIYTRNLVETEHDLGDLLETAAKQVAKDRENEANVSAEAAGEEDRLEKELFDTPSDEKYYTASDEADFQDFEEDLEEQDNLIMRRLLQEEEE